MPSSARILIVDDVDENIDLLTRLLKRAGYGQICSTTNPTETLGIVEQWHPDLIVLDLEMPAMTGLEVLTEIRALPIADADVPVLILTGTTSPDAEWMSLAKGAGDFVRKPWQGAELLLRVKNLIDGGLAHRQLSDVPVDESAKGTQSEEAVHPPLGILKIAHDLNNWLTQISGYADLIALEAEEGESLASDVAHIQRAAKQASHLTAELLELGSGKRPEEG